MNALRRSRLWLCLFVLALAVPPGARAQTAAAVSVLGQPDFVSKTTGVSATQFNGPNGVAVDAATGKLFVADRGNHRVLRFASAAALQTGGAAEAVFGQDDFTSKVTGVAANRMNNPIGVHVDASGRLYVADFSNNRVLRFDDAATKASSAPADGVLGQATFTTSTAAVGATGMRGPVTVQVDRSGRLWVTDFSNHRVLRFDDAATKANGAAADGVLGQADFTTNAAGLSATAMSSPNGAFADDDGHLWVSDNGNYRVTRFDGAAAKANGAAADGVLGQADFTTKATAVTQAGFGTLRYVYVDAAKRLYVVQENSHRITLYDNAADKPDGAPADAIWGQPNYTTGTAANPPTAASFNTPRALFVDDARGHVWIADWANHRVLRYGLPVEGTRAVAFVAPTGGESVGAGTVQTVRWTSQNVTRIALAVSIDDGSTWTALDTVDASAGFAAWTVPATLTAAARLRLRAHDDPTVQATSGAFAIVAPSRSVTLVSPDGYQQWTAGTRRRVLFTARDVATVDLAYSLDDGRTWTIVAADVDAATGSIAWTTPEVVSSLVRVRVSSSADASIADVSTMPFDLVAAPTAAAQPFVFFADSPAGGVLDASYGFANAPSLLDHQSSKLPLSPAYGFGGTYAVRLAWTSNAGGDWGAAIASPGWVGRDVTTKDTLELRVFTEEAIPAAALPLLYLEDLSNRKTGRIHLAATGSGWDARTWNHVRVPISAFRIVAGTADLTRVKTVFFGQDAADATARTVHVGDVRMTGGTVISGETARVIVVLGSSTAAGTGATSPDSAWVGRLRTALRAVDPSAHVVNLAVGGYTTYDVLPSDAATPAGRPTPKTENNVTNALTYRPDAIVVNLPSNDANLGVSVAEQMANLRAIRDEAARQGVPVWVTTTQPRNFADDARRQNLRIVRDSILAQFGPRAIDVWSGLATATGTIVPSMGSGDGIHLSDAGHRYVYDQVRASTAWTYVTTAAEAVEPPAATAVLEPARPNPVATTAAIHFSLPTSTHVRVDVFDLLGRRVARLVDAPLGAGPHDVDLDVTGFPSGVYVYRLDAGPQTLVRRLVVAR